MSDSDEMAVTQEKIFSLRDKLRKHNPSIDIDHVDYLFLPVGAMTHIDYINPKENELNNYIDYILYRAGCARIIGQGVSLSEEFLDERRSFPHGCSWKIYSPDFLKPINELTRQERKELNIYDLAKRLDVVNKAKLIVDTSNNGSYHLIPDEEGNKTVAEACSVVVPNKEELPVCGLRKIFGDDFRVKVAAPKDLSERVLIPLINKSLGPVSEEVWAEVKEMGRETGIFKLKEIKDLSRDYRT